MNEKILNKRCKEFEKLSWFDKWGSWGKFKQRMRDKILLKRINRVNRKRRKFRGYSENKRSLWYFDKSQNIPDNVIDFMLGCILFLPINLIDTYINNRIMRGLLFILVFPLQFLFMVCLGIPVLIVAVICATWLFIVDDL
jgi:hypothetical protein